MGAFQILAEPLILSFSDSKTLGIAETICACGMLASSIVLGIKGIKINFVRALGIALMSAGAFMFGFGTFENIILICCFGFMFFAALPVANNCLDYLARTNIAEEAQGRAWGLISFLSQIGYIVAYGIMGMLADKIAELKHTTVGRGAAQVIMVSGVLLMISAAALYTFRSVRSMENHERTTDSK